MEIVYNPIGIIHSPLTKREDSPIQGRLAPDVKGRIEIYPEYEEGLLDLDGFSHLIILYHFHLSQGYKLRAKPFLDDKEHGVFAIRAPKRPNPIGLSIIKLDKVEGRILHVSELDVLDQTPLLDIKPYVSAFDHRDNVRDGWVEKCMGEGHRTHADDRFK